MPSGDKGCDEQPQSVAHILAGAQPIDSLFDVLLKPAMEQRGRLFPVKQDATITNAGLRSDQIYYVVDGRFKAQRILSDGRSHVIGFAGPRDVFGNPFAAAPADSTFVALTEGKVLGATRVAVVDAIAESSFLQSAMLLAAATEIRFRSDHIVPIARSAAEVRVSVFLLEEYHAHRRRAPAGGSRSRIPLAMARRDIADYVGLTIETVSRTLSLLKRAGIISLPNSREIEINDFDALNAAAGLDVVHGDAPRLYF